MCSVPAVMLAFCGECCAGGCGMVIQSDRMLLCRVPLGCWKIADIFMGIGGVRYGAVHFMDIRNSTGAVY